MPLRLRLLLILLVPHLALAGLGGWAAWRWVESSLRHQAEERARAVGSVLAGGGFTANAAVLERMRALTGADFRLCDPGEPQAPGTVRVEAGGRMVEVGYRTAAYQQARTEVLVVAAGATAAGAALIAALALLTAHGVARPLERLAAAAERIGAGDLATPVPPAGGGEVRALAAVLERSRVRLGELDRQHRQDERLATLGTFTATIAHEVRNPLSAVRLTVQLAARERGGDPRLEALVDELDRLDLTVDELLGFARGMAVDPQPCDLAQAVEDAFRLLRRQAAHAAVDLERSGDTALVLADPRRLRQLLLNLVLNAMQARRGGHAATRITVRLRPDGLAVEDDGPGVDPGLVPHLFEPFVSGRRDGTGLGLHLARAIAEAHGARLSHRPAPGGGAVFILAGLPAA